MKDKSSNSSRRIFIISTVVTAAVLAFALIGFTLRNRSRITDENREYLVDNAVQMAQSIDSALTDGYANIKMLSSMVSDSLDGPEFEVANIQNYIRNSVFDFVEFADTEGMDHNITGGVSDARDRKYYLDAKEGNSGMELIYVSRATHETLLMFYSPLYYEGEFAGSLVGVYQAANRITKLLSSQYFGETATAYLADGNGRIIASNLEFDPQNEMYIGDLAEGSTELKAELDSALASRETAVFSLPGNRTGCCLVKLPSNDGYLVQIFPAVASEKMIKSANVIGYELTAILMLLYIAVMAAVIVFYRRQQAQLREAYDEARDARVAAEAANRAKTDFLFSMSHDIRTPMNAIIGFTNMAVKNIGNREKVTECLDKTQKSGTMLLSLINSVLEVSRIEAGHAQLEEQPGDVYYSFANIEHTMQETAGTKDIDLSFEIGKIKDRFVYADFSRCMRIFVNVISNAIKYTPEGGTVKVKCEQIESEKDGYGTYRYTVTDNGIGMSEEFQEHIFDQFAREETSTVSGVQGSGLGMTVVKSFTELLGGTVDVHSVQGQGTTVEITLPFRIQEGEMFTDPESGLVVTKDSAPASAEFFNLKGLRVLLVDDNELNRELACEILEDEGLTAEEADDGTTAVDIMKDRGPDYYDFILMDIQMPKMNGYEATKTIRAMYPERHIPIIALSANAFAEDRQKSLEAGMDAHIAKPINITELLGTINRILNNY